MSSFPSPFQSPITGISLGKSPAQTHISGFPDIVAVRVKAPDPTARTEDPYVILSIAIPVADNRYVIGQSPAQTHISGFPDIVAVRVKAPDPTARTEDPYVILSIAIPVSNNRLSSGSPQLRLTSVGSQILLPFESRLQIPLLGRKIPILLVTLVTGAAVTLINVTCVERLYPALLLAFNMME